jgi:DNA-binding NarL/FixJ family response regulator
MAEVIKVLVADDHPVIRAGLAKILGTQSDITIVGEARDGLEAINKALELKPDVILMDIFMPRCSGLEATVAIRQKLPDARLLILTISEREEDLLQALRLGAQGYLLKSAAITEVAEAVRKTAAGEAMLSPSIAARLVAELRQKAEDKTNLSARETEVLQLVGEGLTNTEIANRLFISESTVRTYLHRLLDKLHLKNRAEAIAYAVRHLVSKPL